MDYKDWLAYQSKLQGRDVSQDEQEYDLRKYFDSLKANPIEAVHLPDTYKLPTHPTFSDQSMYHVPVIQQGGSWGQQDNGNWQFTPSDTNLKNMRKDALQGYFNDVEAQQGPEALNIPNQDRMSTARADVLKQLSQRSK